jgi:hypothetical protein
VPASRPGNRQRNRTIFHYIDVSAQRVLEV